MTRLGRDRLSVGEAGPVFGGTERLRAIATSRQVFTLWKRRGVPWEVVGPVVWPIVLAYLSHSAQRPLHPGSIGAVLMPHEYEIASQQMTRIFNERSRFPERWQAVKALLDALSPSLQPKAIARKTAEVMMPSGHAVSR